MIDPSNSLTFLGKAGLCCSNRSAVRVTDVSTKPFRDKGDRGALSKARQPQTAGEIATHPCYTEVIKQLPAFNSCEKDSNQGSKRNPIVKTPSVFAKHCLGALFHHVTGYIFWDLLSKP